MYNIIKMPEYKCTRCFKIFSLKGNYTRHINRKFPCKKYISFKFNCDKCGKKFSSKQALSRHFIRKKPCVNNNFISNNEYVLNLEKEIKNKNLEIENLKLKLEYEKLKNN